MTDINEKFLPPHDMPAFHQPFWEGLKNHRLLLQQCDNGHFRFIPTEICQFCGSEAWAWNPVSGAGRVYSYTVVHRGPTPAYQQDGPYVIAHVELEEGPRMIGNLVGCDPSTVAIGMRVMVMFDDVSPEWTLYRFMPATSEGGA